MPNVFSDIFCQAAALNREDARRRGNVVELDAFDDILVSGDVHGSRHNLTRLLEIADLSSHPGRQLVLQEIIHGPIDSSGLDRSSELLMRAARAKIAHPNNILLLLGNHDIAQVMGNEITKEGHGVCKAFIAGVQHAFGEQADEVAPALYDFLLSLPLAVRCPNRVMVLHSLPSPHRMDKADLAVFSQTGYRQEDLQRGGAAYEWTWGRNQTPEQMAELSAKLDADFFIIGHRHTEAGRLLIKPNAVSITTDHEHGHVMHFTPADTLSLDAIDTFLKPLAALDRDSFEA